MHFKNLRLRLLLLLVLIAGLGSCVFFFFLLLVFMEGLSSNTFEVLASFAPSPCFFGVGFNLILSLVITCCSMCEKYFGLI